MSVLACSRPDCDNIMCDNLYKYKMYVCNECLDEFREYMKQNPLVQGWETIDSRFEEFIQTDKGRSIGHEVYDQEQIVEKFINELKYF